MCVFTVCLFITVLQGQGISDAQALEKAKKILQESPLIDGHNDLPWVIRTLKTNARKVEAFDLKKRQEGDTDIPRLREGMVGAQFWSVYIPANISSGYTKAQMEQIDIALRMIELYPDDFELAKTADDVMRIFKSGKIAGLLGMEGGKAIENSLAALRMFYRLGARYMGLTHNITTDWADAALDTAKHGGLTRFGEEVILEMNRLGMLVDLSHSSDGTMEDVLRVSRSPVIYSHSNVRALANHKRNVPDSLLLALKKNGGVIMVSVIPNYTSQKLLDWDAGLDAHLKNISGRDEKRKAREEYKKKLPPPAVMLKDVAAHMEYIRRLIGVDHVGIGADFYGDGDSVDDMKDVSGYPKLIAELVKLSWSDEDIKKAAGLNVLRVLKQNEEIARELQKKSVPSDVLME